MGAGYLRDPWATVESPEDNRFEKLSSPGKPQNQVSKEKGIMRGAVPWDELLRSDGADGGRILVAILGVVYDASDEKGRGFFGAGGPYAVMAGHDATFMLANMSLKPADADRFVGYGADDLQAIAEWIAYFDSSYGRYGWLVGAPASHGATLRELPPVPRKKMGPNVYGGDGDDATQLARNAAAQDEYERALAACGELGRETAAPAAPAAPAAAVAAVAAVEAAPFSSAIFRANRHKHSLVMRGELMMRCVDGTIARKAYARFLAQLYYVYSELEAQLTLANADRVDGNPVAALHDPRLERLPALVEDLTTFLGSAWRELLPGPTLATIRYVARVAEVAAMGAAGRHRLAVHHWMRYGAGLAGGQFLRTSLARGLGMAGRGVRYHEFEQLGDSTAVSQFYHRNLKDWDGVGAHATEAERAAMFEEASLAFDLNIAMNDAVMPAGEAAL